MPTASTPLVSVSNVDVVCISGGQETPLARAATVTLSMVAGSSASSSPNTTPKRRTPPPPPGSTGPAGAATTSSIASSVPPPYSSATTPRTSSAATPKLQEHIQLSVASPKDGLNLLEVPLPSGKQTISSIVTIPPATYIIPDPVRNGFVKLVLPTGAAGAVDAETRELFEAALFTNLDSPTGIASSDGITELQAQRNQLYIVDEDTGRLIGQLDNVNGAHLEEAEALAAGQVQDGKTQGGAFGGGKMADLDEHEAVVIDTVVTTGEGSDGTGTITYTVQPASAYYRPVDNPTNSKILSTANTVSRGLVIGSELLARQLQRGTGHWVSSRPATQTPMQFSETTKGAFHKSSEWTRTATVYSGKAVGAIGNAAARLGDRIGRKTGVQEGADGKPPAGWKGTLATTLKGINVVADHLEASSKAVIDSTTKSASTVINHSYGSEARDLADNVGSSVKHVALVYIDARGVTRRALVKGVGKAAIKARMADGSQLYLSGNESELKQIEAAANQEAAAQASGGSLPANEKSPAATGSTLGPASLAAPPYTAQAGSLSSTTTAGLTSPGSGTPPAPMKRRTPPPPPPLPSAASPNGSRRSSLDKPGATRF